VQQTYPSTNYFRESVTFSRRLPIRAPEGGKGLLADGENNQPRTRVNGFLRNADG
jgi:hypothetical protein